MPLENLLNTNYIRKNVNQSRSHCTKKQMANLFHGEKVKTVIDTCFSEKKSRRKHNPNVFRRTYFSKILNIDIWVYVSDVAIREIKKLDGFDNYILLTKPKDMESYLGEYLRELMLRKLNDPDLDLDNAIFYKKI